MFKDLSIQNDTTRLLHEAFVSNNTGTTPWELATAVTPWFFSSFFVQLFQSWSFFRSSSIFAFLIEFIISVLPQLCMVTIGEDYLLTVLIASIVSLVGVIILKIIILSYRGYYWPIKFGNLLVKNPEKMEFCFLDNIRCHLSVITCIAILAVDFKIFPRRFAKTEFFGYGLMDTGVGFFMLVNGYVAPEAKKKYNAQKRFEALKKSVISSLPLILIGIIRVVMVKLMNYQEHVTEYGVHWNFFFSLVAAKIGSSIVFLVFPPVASAVAAAIVAISYQICLHYGLRDIVFNGIDGTDSRSNIIDANREGLCASIGFVCLYLAGVQYGYFYFRIGSTLRTWLRSAVILFCANATITILAILSDYYIESASRRLINVTYILWLSAFLAWLVFMWLVIDMINVVFKYLEGEQQDKYCFAKPTLINMSVSYNFLLCFLIANLLTGLVNVSMNTISVTESSGFIVMASYMFVLLGIVAMFYKKKWKVKFW